MDDSDQLNIDTGHLSLGRQTDRGEFIVQLSGSAGSVETRPRYTTGRTHASALQMVRALRGSSIRATAVLFGAGPGMGGTAYIHFRREGDVYRVFLGGSAGGEGREEVGTVPAAAGWRGRITFVLEEAAPSHESQNPDDIRVTGASGLEAELLALAWSGEDGVLAARTLLLLQDCELQRLADVDAISARECIDALRELDDLLSSDDEAILAAIRVALAAEPFTWETAVSEARRVAAVLDQEMEAAAAARREALAPFAAEIDTLLSALQAFLGGGGGTHYQWLMTAQRVVVQRFLEDYALVHGALPSGVHRLSFRWFSDPHRVLDLDVDALRAFASRRKDG